MRRILLPITLAGSCFCGDQRTRLFPLAIVGIGVHAMAGSPSQSHLSGPFTDPILSARLEALKQLADGLTDRVAVMDQEYNLIYANEPAWGRLGEAQRLTKSAKCYEAFLQMSNPCGSCPATTVFETGTVQTISCGSAVDGTACGMRQAFPLVSAKGHVASVL